jgi:hypothetical protein
MQVAVIEEAKLAVVATEYPIKFETRHQAVADLA